MNIEELELKARAGEAVPKNIGLAEASLFTGLRGLYWQYDNGVIDIGKAKADKQHLIMLYNQQKERDAMLLHVGQRQCLMAWKVQEANSQYRKERTLENADRLVDILDGIGV